MEVFAGKPAITLMMVKSFLWIFFITIFSKSMALSYATELYGTLSMAYMPRNDFPVATKPYYGSLKTMITPSTSIRFVFLLSIPENDTLKGQIRANLPGIH